MEHLRRYFLLYTIIPLFILAGCASYYRFVVLQDYTVQYEVDCDPRNNSCFVGCENEECTEVYHYHLVTRHAQAIHTLCGPDVTDCEAAQSCTPEESACEVVFCDPALAEECSVLNTSL